MGAELCIDGNWFRDVVVPGDSYAFYDFAKHSWCAMRFRPICRMIFPRNLKRRTCDIHPYHKIFIYLHTNFMVRIVYRIMS